MTSAAMLFPPISTSSGIKVRGARLILTELQRAGDYFVELQVNKFSEDPMMDQLSLSSYPFIQPWMTNYRKAHLEGYFENAGNNDQVDKRLEVVFVYPCPSSPSISKEISWQVLPVALQTWTRLIKEIVGPPPPPLLFQSTAGLSRHSNPISKKYSTNVRHLSQTLAGSGCDARCWARSLCTRLVLCSNRNQEYRDSRHYNVLFGVSCRFAGLVDHDKSLPIPFLIGPSVKIGYSARRPMREDIRFLFLSAVDRM